MNIIPFTSVGEIYFLDSRKDIQRKLNSPFISGVKEFEEIKDFYDHFTEKGLLVYYDKFDMVTAFEFFKGDILFKDVSLFQQSYKYLFHLFSGLDPNLTVDFTGFTSEKFGIAIYAPESIDETSVKVQSVFIFRKGYYDE